MATKENVFGHIIQIAYTQTLWQFIGTLAVSNINKSTFQAKENAVMTLVYINIIRISLFIIMENNDNQLLSMEFMSEMASIKERRI